MTILIKEDFYIFKFQSEIFYFATRIPFSFFFNVQFFRWLHLLCTIARCAHGIFKVETRVHAFIAPCDIFFLVTHKFNVF